MGKETRLDFDDVLVAYKRALKARADVELAVLKMTFQIDAIRTAMDKLPKGDLSDHKDRHKALL